MIADVPFTRLAELQVLIALPFPRTIANFFGYSCLRLMSWIGYCGSDRGEAGKKATRMRPDAGVTRLSHHVTKFGGARAVMGADKSLSLETSSHA